LFLFCFLLFCCFVGIFCLFVFEVRPHYVAQASLELKMPQLPE
jgi:uncharacterized protein involved in exopolysaccharide biosynthesis